MHFCGLFFDYTHPRLSVSPCYLNKKGPCLWFGAISDVSSSDPYCLFPDAVSRTSSAPFIIPGRSTSFLAHFRIPEFANAAAFHITKDPGPLPREGNYLLCLGDTKNSSRREVPTYSVHAGADLNQF